MKSNDFSPIAEQGELELEAGIFSKLKRRREIAPVAPGFVRILLDTNGAPIEELTAGQKYWSRAHGWVKVDVRSHTLEYEISFADPSGLASFVAVVDVAVAVTDPAGSVKEGAESVEEIVRPALQNAIRKAHGGSAALADSEDPIAVLNELRVTADRNLEALVGTVPKMPGWLSAKVTSVSVGLDEATEGHRKELMSKVRAVALADADGKSEIAKAKNELMIRQVWEDGFANHLADPEKRALARIAADPSRENIDRVAGQFDQIEAQGRAAIVETLREAINKGYFAEDDAIHNAISALEKQYGNPQHALGASAPSGEIGAPSGTDEHVVDAETVETETAGEDEAEAQGGSGDNDDDKSGSDSDWTREPMFLLAPVQWLVNLVTVLPDLLRPGVFIGLVLLILWFVFIQRGLPNLWHALCRGSARLIDAVVGIVLLPDYLVTTARQKQDQAPGQAFLMVGGVAERILDGAGALNQRHLRDPIEWKPFPWKPLAIVVAVVTVPWVVMELTSPKSVVRQELAQGYNVWRDVEDWAGVDSSRRAAPGVVWPPRPRALSSRHRGRTVGVTVRCNADDRCGGRLVLRSGKGRRLHSREISVRPGATTTVHMKLSREEASTHRVLVRVARADPE